MTDTFPFPEVIIHDYLSTACHHAVADGQPQLHYYCKSMTGYQGAKRAGTCKFCEAKCVCPCHAEDWESKPESYLRVVPEGEDLDLREEDDPAQDSS
jgi:hypothetical protein